METSKIIAICIIMKLVCVFLGRLEKGEKVANKIRKDFYETERGQVRKICTKRWQKQGMN